MWDVAEKTDRMNTLEEWLQTHPGHVDGNAKMPMALLKCNGRVKISEANAWRMVYDGKTSRETSADHTTRLHTYPQEARL
jgi:hypothetical protein